jgi:hypothetical protein
MLIETKECSPNPRTTQIMTEYQDQLSIWGEFNGKWSHELHVLDLTTMTWSQYPQKIAERTDLPCVRLNSLLYASGGFQNDRLLTLDFQHYQLQLNEMRGTQFRAVFFIGSWIVLIHNFFFFFFFFDSLWWSVRSRLDCDICLWSQVNVLVCLSCHTWWWNRLYQRRINEWKWVMSSNREWVSNNHCLFHANEFEIGATSCVYSQTPNRIRN